MALTHRHRLYTHTSTAHHLTQISRTHFSGCCRLSSLACRPPIALAVEFGVAAHTESRRLFLCVAGQGVCCLYCSPAGEKKGRAADEHKINCFINYLPSLCPKCYIFFASLVVVVVVLRFLLCISSGIHFSL